MEVKIPATNATNLGSCSREAIILLEDSPSPISLDDDNSSRRRASTFRVWDTIFEVYAPNLDRLALNSVVNKFDSISMSDSTVEGIVATAFSKDDNVSKAVWCDGMENC
eukprot:44041_1